MTFSLIALVLALLLPLTGCVTDRDFPSIGPAADPSIEERRILVTFTDSSIERKVPGNILDRYRAHGRYMSSAWSTRVAIDLAEEYGLKLMAEWPVTVLRVVCVVYEIPIDQTPADTIQTIAQDRRVESVQIMRNFRVLANETSASLGGDPYFRLQKNLQSMHIEGAHRLATGRGVRIALVDTGVDDTHPDLRGQIAVSKNLASSNHDKPTDDVHGTAVAGIVAARLGNGIGIVGVAPDAKIYALKACWPERFGSVSAVCNSFTLLAALNEAVRLGIPIVNLSLTGPDDPLVGRLLRAAIDRGILVVAADASENGPNTGFPANQTGVIAVRAAQTDRKPKAAANDGITAPGTDILTTLPHGRYDFVSGSSFAAPHVTGLLALMRQLKPSLTAPEAIDLLRASAATSAQAPDPLNRVVDACLALARLLGIPNCRKPS
jgi:subtilisin family serine protease